MSPVLDWIVEDEPFGIVVEDGERVDVYVLEDSRYHRETTMEEENDNWNFD